MPNFATGLDRLLQDPALLRGRRYGLLAHAATLTRDLVPAHCALERSGVAPTVLFGPEHGFYGVEQDMVPSADELDPWTGVPIVSLYGSDEHSLRPRPDAFAGLDLVVLDVQDVGSRYYTFAATAVWTAQAARAAGVEVWLLDRANPLGGSLLEGPGVRAGFESFVGAFDLPVRHGLTVGEIARLIGRREGWWDDGLRVWEARGWDRDSHWGDLERPWIAPSPNMPSYETALVYPGLCLLEATTLSEGRGTTRPFRLLGAPGVDPLALWRELALRPLDGLRFVPTYFRPQFQKHAGAVCGGVEIAVIDAARVRPLRAGVELLRALRRVAPHAWSWRAEPYEFVIDRPAIDLLTGSEEFRTALDAGDDAAVDRWIDSWSAEENRFAVERSSVLLYAAEPR